MAANHLLISDIEIIDEAQLESVNGGALITATALILAAKVGAKIGPYAAFKAVKYYSAGKWIWGLAKS